jgi:transposase-like protein
MDDHGRMQENQPPLGGLERSEKPPSGGRRAAGGEDPQLRGVDPEVPEKPVRRRYTAEYKLRILDEADACTEHGQLGALLRREGLYSSHLRTWRKQREEGILNGLTPKKRGRKGKPKDPVQEENQRLRRENQRLVARLKQAETIIEVQKKLSEALGIPLDNSETNASEE